MDKQYDEQFMQRAIELSKIAYTSGRGLPVGCVIVSDGKIVGEGQNEMLGTKDPTAHAEMLAIREACKNLSTPNLSDCQLYTTLEPCPMCFGAIHWAQVGVVYFANAKEDAFASGFVKSNIVEELQKDPANRLIPMHHKKNEKAKSVLKDWQAKA